MTFTKVFATKEEIEALCKPHPYLIFGTMPANDKGERLPIESESAQQHCHRLALAHGLPEFDGYYGCDLETGEFVKP